MTGRRINIVLMLLTVLTVGACHLRPLEDPSEMVKIRVDVNVKAVVNVTGHLRYSTNPRIDQLTKEKEDQLSTDMMRVLVYDPSSLKLVTESFITAKTVSENGDDILTGNLSISYGTFNLLVYNFDTPTTQIKNENNEGQILAYTNPLPAAQRYSILGTKTDDFENVSINYEPEHLLVAREQSVRVSPHDTVVVIHTEARSVIDTYYIQIHCENMQYASTKATAVITGLSPSNAIGLGIRTEDPTAAVCFDLKQSTDTSLPSENKDVLCAVFNTFGKIDHATSNLHVTFNVVDTGGNLQQKEVNLDKVFQTKEAIENHWLLVTETWVLEKPEVTPTGGGGFQPEVCDWDEVIGNITI